MLRVASGWRGSIRGRGSGDRRRGGNVTLLLTFPMQGVLRTKFIHGFINLFLAAYKLAIGGAICNKKDSVWKQTQSDLSYCIE